MGLLARIGGVLTSIPPPTARLNWLDNASFVINQRAYATGTTLAPASGAADAYGPDRWKILNGNSGSLAMTALPNGNVQVTTTGSWNQVIPGYRVTSTTAFVSWLGTANYITVNGVNYTFSGTVTIGADVRRYAYVTGLTIGNNLTVVLQPSAVFAEVMLEGVPAAGYPVGPYQRLRASVDLQECERYYQSSFPTGSAPGAKTNSAYVYYMSAPSLVANVYGGSIVVPFQPAMRATPTLTLYSPVTGLVGKVADVTNGVDVTPTIMTTTTQGAAFRAALNAAATSCLLTGHFTASADF